jgi:hypothetical protein
MMVLQKGMFPASVSYSYNLAYGFHMLPELFKTSNRIILIHVQDTFKGKPGNFVVLQFKGSVHKLEISLIEFTPFAKTVI